MVTLLVLFFCLTPKSMGSQITLPPASGSSSATVSITANRAAVSNGSGALTAATTTATEIGYVNGVTSAIQTQLGNKLTTPTSDYGLAYTGASGGGNHHGSTATKVRRYANVTSAGSSVSCTNDSTNGSSCTVNASGLYFMQTCDSYNSGVCEFGITVNASSLTTNIFSVSFPTQRLFYTNNSATNTAGCGTSMAYLTANDVVRTMTDGNCNDTFGGLAHLKVVRIY